MNRASALQSTYLVKNFFSSEFHREKDLTCNILNSLIYILDNICIIIKFFFNVQNLYLILTKKLQKQFYVSIVYVIKHEVNV